jgi:hypothetical protein
LMMSKNMKDLPKRLKQLFLINGIAGNGIFADKSTLEDGESPQPMSQACQCFPVWLGIIEGKDAQDAADALVKRSKLTAIALQPATFAPDISSMC